MTKEELASYNRAYRGKNRDAIAAKKRAHYQNNRDKILKRVSDRAKAKGAEIADYQRDYRARNGAKLAERKREWATANREQIAERRRDYFEQYHREYKRKNYARVLAWNANRRACRVRATPVWADLAAIRVIYTEAVARRVAGENVHVDHMVPLISEFVCGLHVPANLQIIPAAENISKHNRVWPDMWPE